jgi:hypothetical protein
MSTFALVIGLGCVVFGVTSLVAALRRPRDEPGEFAWYHLIRRGGRTQDYSRTQALIESAVGVILGLVVLLIFGMNE